MLKLIDKIKMWFVDRGLQNASPTKQMLKLFEEVGELASAMARDQIDKIKDAIGDIVVVLIGLTLQLGIDFEECVELAYDEIKDRKGKLINGVFVKEEDL
mgnify:CR=1 FL=1